MQLVQLVVTVVGVVVSIKWFIHQRKNSELQIEQPKVNKLVSYMDKLKDYLTRIDHSCYQAYELNLEKWLPTDMSVDFNNYEREAKDRYRVFIEYLAKYRKKDDWETIISEYNKYCEELYKKKDDLSKKLKELLDNNSVVIEEAYNKSSYAKNNGKIAFISELYDIERFLENYKHRKESSSLDGAWYYIGIQKFDEFINVLKSDLDEIDKIITKMDDLINKLIDILDGMSARLKKDYRL
jgi:prefoldin subunit 5